MSRYEIKDKTIVMTELEEEISPPQEKAMFQGKEIMLIPIKYRQIYWGEFPRGKVKNVKVGDDPKACERLKQLGYEYPHNHCFVLQIDKLRQNDKKFRQMHKDVPTLRVCVNCGICQIDGALIRA